MLAEVELAGARELGVKLLSLMMCFRYFLSQKSRPCSLFLV